MILIYVLIIFVYSNAYSNRSFDFQSKTTIRSLARHQSLIGTPLAVSRSIYGSRVRRPPVVSSGTQRVSSCLCTSQRRSANLRETGEFGGRWCLLVRAGRVAVSRVCAVTRQSRARRRRGLQRRRDCTQSVRTQYPAQRRQRGAGRVAHLLQTRAAA